MIQGYTSCSICPELTALCCWWIHSAHPVNLRTGLAMVLLFNVAGTWQQFSRHLPLRALVLWEMNSLLTVWVRGPLRLRDQSHQPLLWVTLEKTQWWKLCPVSPICSEGPPESPTSANYSLCFPMPGPPSRNFILVYLRSLSGPGETARLVKDACYSHRRVMSLNFQKLHKCWGGIWWCSHIPSTPEG